MELFKANKQWSTRPADERFASIRELHDACKAYAATAKENTVEVSNLRTEAIDGDVQIVGRRNNAAKLTHWAFGQLSARVGAPGAYLRDLPATLACQNLNYGLANLADKTDTAKLLFHQNGGLLLRAFTSDKYARIWNWEVAERLLQLETQGWSPATPDKRFDGGDPTQCQVCNGTGSHGTCTFCKGTGKVFPALYASDHDMFAFIRNSNVTIKEPGNPDGLQRGVIVSNSEVGAASLDLLKFFYREVCGNFIVWGATNVLEMKVRHIGDARNRWAGYYGQIKRYLDSSASQDEAKIAAAQTVKIGTTKDEVLDKLFGMRSLVLSRKTLEGGYDAVNPDQDGDPRSVWGMVQGLTRFSQSIPYADQRMVVDKAAGKLMEAAF